MNTAIYLRVSTDDQIHASQELSVNEWAKRMGHENLTTYRDTISGKTHSRPELDKLLLDCRSGKVDRILCYRLDRLGRSAYHLQGLVLELKKLKIPVYFTSQNLSTEEEDIMGNFMVGLLGLIAQMERETIVERVKSGLRARKARGFTLGRKPISEEKKALCKDMRSKGCSIREISHETKLSIGAVYKACK